ncbi:MAG TPA: protein kinase [Polyangiaceae bacterium LLY-WYZ-15_(1-7)]|nr:protein kinase [Polyangiaceae bacterium LLY-WYZ-15_(1-7)]
MHLRRDGIVDGCTNTSSCPNTTESCAPPAAPGTAPPGTPPLTGLEATERGEPLGAASQVQAATSIRAGRASSTPPLLAPGELVDGTYEVLRLLGEGGMAQVFEARDRALDRVVALKVATASSEGPGSLRAEARALAAFRHPSLLTVHTLGRHRGLDFLVLERIYGVSLQRHLKARRAEGRRFDVPQVLGLVAELADGLAVLHRAGLAHRDVKPSNVMLSPDGRVVLMDFGLALPEFELADQAVLAGSPPYMPPEAFANAVEPGGGRYVDLFALGVLTYELLVFERPFPGRSAGEVWDAHQRGVRPDLRAVRHDAPPALVRLVHEMLSPAPEDRPASAEGVAWELRALIAKQRSRSAATTEPPAGAEARAAGAPLRVLLVEDDEDMARVLAFYTQQILGRDVELRRARDGVEAIDAVRAEAPDLLLLDLHMPRMNGIEVCMELRGARLAPHARIVSVSAGAQEHDLQLLHALGMHHFVPKGQDLRGRLEAALRELFPLHVSRAAEGSRE